MIRITSTVALDDHEVEERFVRASGPGGQNVNKVATAVELRFDIQASSLPDEVKARLRTQVATRLTRAGVLVLDSREHRTQVQNRAAARARLAALIRRALVRPRTRRPTRPKPAARDRRLATKKRRGAIKSLRGRSRDED